MKLLTKIHNTTDPIITIEAIGPAQASAMLELNRRNRHVSQPAVASLARDMAAGNWHMTGEAIKFDVDGDLIDGQHRLWAVIESGAVIQFVVIRNLRPDAQDVMDTGRKRSASDALSLNGWKYSTIVAAAARLLINYEAGNIKKAAQQNLQTVTNAEILDYANANPSITSAAAWTSQHYRTLGTNKGPTAAGLFILRNIDEDAANEFYEDLAQMRTSGQGDPRLTFLRRLQAAKDNGEHLGAVEQLHYIFRAWNAIREGQDLHQLKVGGKNGSAFDFARPV